MEGTLLKKTIDGDFTGSVNQRSAHTQDKTLFKLHDRNTFGDK